MSNTRKKQIPNHAYGIGGGYLFAAASFGAHLLEQTEARNYTAAASALSFAYGVYSLYQEGRLTRGWARTKQLYNKYAPTLWTNSQENQQEAAPSSTPRFGY